MEIIEKSLLPVLLSYLESHPTKQLLWAIQNPTTDLLGPITEHNNYIIHVKEINKYNQMIRHLFG